MAAPHRDGVIELFGGMLLLGLGAMWLVAPGTVGIFAALYVIFGLPLIERVKRRVTYPRIGYAKPPGEGTRRLVLGMLGYVVAMFALTVLVMVGTGGADSAAQWRRWAPLMFGLMSSGGFLHTARISGLARYRVIAIGSIALGFGIGWSGDGADYSGVAVHLLVLGTVLVVIGLVELLRFVRADSVSSDRG
jgi:hypothetical protein